MRFLLHGIFKILLMPLILMLMLFRIIFICFSGMTVWIFWTLASFCFFIAIGMYGMGNSSGREIFEMFLTGVIIFAVPVVAIDIVMWISSAIGFLMGL